MIAVTTRRVTAAPTSAAASATATKIAVTSGLAPVLLSASSAERIPRSARPAPVPVISSRRGKAIGLIAAFYHSISAIGPTGSELTQAAANVVTGVVYMIESY